MHTASTFLSFIPSNRDVLLATVYVDMICSRVNTFTVFLYYKQEHIQFHKAILTTTVVNINFGSVTMTAEVYCILQIQILLVVILLEVAFLHGDIYIYFITFKIRNFTLSESK